jgi:hypothetical protein
MGIWSARMVAQPARLSTINGVSSHTDLSMPPRRDAGYDANAWARAAPTGGCCRRVSSRSS